MSFLSRSHHSTVTNYGEFVENLRTGKQKPPGNISPLQAMEEFFKELGNFLKDNNFRNLDEVLETAKNIKEASGSITMDYRKYHGSKPETWEARHLENFASNMGPNSVLGAGLLQHLADALRHSGYENLGELIHVADRPNPSPSMERISIATILSGYTPILTEILGITPPMNQPFWASEGTWNKITGMITGAVIYPDGRVFAKPYYYRSL